MRNKIRYTRIALATVGVWTVAQGLRVILIATAQFSAPETPSDTPAVALLLGALLALGGGCLTVRGITYQGRVA